MSNDPIQMAILDVEELENLNNAGLYDAAFEEADKLISPHTDTILTALRHTYNPETHILVERAKVPEDVGAAVDILVGHNKWRRGDAHEPSCTSFELGKVIEKVCQSAALVAEGGAEWLICPN